MHLCVIPVFHVTFLKFYARFDYKQCRLLHLGMLHCTVARLIVQRKYF